VDCIVSSKSLTAEWFAMQAKFEQKLNEFLDEKIHTDGEVAQVSSEVILAGGKRIRPILLLKSFEMAGGKDLDEVFPLAIAFELIHTATLVHDDIYDNAKTRRGVPTLHEKFGLAKAMIAGDWMFVQGFGLGGKFDEKVVEIVSQSCARIASAEYKQLDHILDTTTRPEDYLEIVQGKTAGPFSAACDVAAYLAKIPSKQREELARFGLELGMAFQLVDDLLDIRGDERMGKPRGADVYEGKMTLPLIHAITILHGQDQDELIEIIKKFDDSKFDRLIALLEQANSINYSEILIKNHAERALDCLEAFNDTDSKKLLREIVEYAIDRIV
jgi:octaprenyl-diphosphate synthase